MPEIKEDVMVWPTMTELLGCLEGELFAAGRPVAKSTIQYGSEVPALDMDDECNGFAWVRLSDAYPSARFPEQDTAPGTGGVKMSMAFVLEVAVARCLRTNLDEDGQVFGSDGQALTPEAIFEDAREQMADMAAIRRAICKCLRDQGVKFILGNTVSAAPSGLVNYIGWSVTLEWDPEDV